MERTSWPKIITVDKRIVGLLSRSTYEKFPKAIREAVSNAYDADATAVDINVDMARRRIIIEDNGVGMTPEEFDFYLRIAGQPRGRGESIKFNRKRIGRLGVGFLALFPFCEILEITSTAENSNMVFVATIPCKRFVEESAIVEDVSQIPVEGHERSDPRECSKHYTRLVLNEFTSLVDEYFEPKAGKYTSSSTATISSWPGMKRLTWELQETLPLDFPPHSILGEALNQKPTGMEVRLNGQRLYRNDPGGEILDSNSDTFTTVGNIVFKYAIITNWNTIRPFNARGLKIRLNNVGIGERTHFGLGISGRTWSRLHWIAGEVHILEGLDEAISLDRDSFIWSPKYEEFKEFFRQLLYKQGYKIEDIATAEKKITSWVRSKETARVGPVREIIKHYLDLLQSQGFKIIRENMASSICEKAICLDREKKRVIVVEDHPHFRDTFSFKDENLDINYARWNYHTSNFPACRISEGSKIEVNLDYPLFKGSANAQLFLKLHILLLLARQSTSNQAEMYNYLINALMEEFHER